jgi:hypothetical protein
MKFHNILSLLGYTVNNAAGGASDNYVLIESGSEIAPLYMMFDNITYSNGTSIVSEQEIVAQITKFGFKHDFSEIYFVVDFTKSNIENLDSTYGNNVILLEEVWATASTVTSGYTRLARTCMIGRPTSGGYGVPEGDLFSVSGGLVSSAERNVNYCQIFASDAYGITGTAQASKFRFTDELMEQRNYHLTMYKRKKEAAYLFGVKSETFATSANDQFVNGKPVRTTSGLLDYGMYPIKYFKSSMPSIPTTSAIGNNGVVLLNWLNKLLDSRV